MKIQQTKHITGRLGAFLREHRAALTVMALLFLARLYLVYENGVQYSLGSDDLSYIYSGLRFAQTGMITMHDEYPSAQIMPGMTVLIGLISMVFGEGRMLWVVLKLLWITMGTLSGWFIYRSVRLFAPKWCAVVAMLPLFRPDYMWMDTIILTETPFALSLVMMVYYTLKMGQDKGGYKSFIWCMVSYLAGLMLKANIGPYPVFALVYLLIVRYDRKVLLKQCVILACAVLCFVVPWSIRNYEQYHAFIPLTYGAGNPTLLGTYQGRGYPADESLDYVTNVDEVVKEKYAEFYREDGTPEPEYARYLSLRADAVKAAYRQKVWFETDPKGFLCSYLILKPQAMINSIFYWKTAFGIGGNVVINLPYVEIMLCILTIVAAVVIKKYRAQIFFVLAVYIGNIYIYAATFSFDRYNASLVYLRYIAIGIGISVIVQLLARGVQSVLRHEGMLTDG